jgi:HD superfamily phosphodiesterase
LEKKGFYFHNLDHTLDVFDRATYLLEHEDVDNNFKELVQIAVLFHDS